LCKKKNQFSINIEINLNQNKNSSDECITSLAEFTVYKISERHSDQVRRILCLSEVCIIERDPASYSICTLKPLSEV
jgi:DnaJ homolog subfamily C member 13